MGGEFGIHVYIWLSPFPVHLKLHNIINWLDLKTKVKKKKKNKTCLPNKQTHRKRDQMVGYQRREEERRELEDSGPKVQAFSYK